MGSVREDAREIAGGGEEGEDNSYLCEKRRPGHKGLREAVQLTGRGGDNHQ